MGEAAIAAGPRGGFAVPGGVGIEREAEGEQQVRVDQEVRMMERHVRVIVRQRLRAGPGGIARPLGPTDFLEAEAEGEESAEDPELLAEIARTMAEARARGAPVPNIQSFVERALSRAQQARVLAERLRREAGDMDPDLEDAVAAAESSVQAAARAPRRLGGAPRASGPGS